MECQKPTINKTKTWNHTNELYNEWRYKLVDYSPENLFSLSQGLDGRLCLSIKTRYAIEIIAHLLDRYDCDGKITIEDYCPFTYLDIMPNYLYVTINQPKSEVDEWE